MIIYLATWLYEPSQGEALTKKRKKNRLISYYHTLQRKDEIREYVRTGRNTE